MGGKVFTSAANGDPALTVPRMSPELYLRLKSQYLELLRTLFHRADSPKEAPGKESYGDIDIVVAEPDKLALESIWHNLPPEERTKSAAPSDGEVRLDVLRHVLQSGRDIRNSNSWSFAVPHPEATDAFVQVDVNNQPSDLFDWHVFHQSYGDLWNILGTSIRAYGLTLSETGLYVRDPDIEKLDRKRGRILLTQDPGAVVELMGLTYDEWGTWFTEDDMFAHLVRCRFFQPELYLNKSELKHNDRRRLVQRPCFQRFVEEYIPSVMARRDSKEGLDHVHGVDGCARDTSLGKGGYVEVDRAGVLEEVLDRFDARQRFDDNHRKWMDERDALDKKRTAKAERRAVHMQMQKSYAQHWIDWFLASLTPEERLTLDLDMDK